MGGVWIHEYGRTHVQDISISDGVLPQPHLKPPKPPGTGWELRVATIDPACVTLVGLYYMVKNVTVMEWFNTTTQQVESLGTSSGVFTASPRTSKKPYAYDALIMYEAMRYNMDARSSIKLQHDVLSGRYTARARVDRREGRAASDEAPPFGQFYKHYHAFIKSQVP
jgi:hypothetical protein